MLLDMLRSADPHERDDVAYTELSRRIAEGDADERLLVTGNEMADRFADPEIQTRSFAALILADIAARDRLARLLPSSAVLAWSDRLSRWYRNEPDLRGWDEHLGWLHAVAHGADALGSFGLSRHLGARELRGLLDLARDRLLQPTDVVFANQEDDRLAYAITVVLTRRAR
jgi:hypothetical protein